MWNNRGNVWFKKGDFSHAVADFSAALQIAPAPDLLQPRAGLGALGAAEKAEQDLAKAREIDPNFVPARQRNADAEPEDQKS